MRRPWQRPDRPHRARPRHSRQFRQQVTVQLVGVIFLKCGQKRFDFTPFTERDDFGPFGDFRFNLRFFFGLFRAAIVGLLDGHRGIGLEC